MKRLISLCALVLVVALASAAYADVQSVKVSGDITIRAIARENYDLKDETDNLSATAQGSEDDTGYYMSTTRVQIDAFTIHLPDLNERVANRRTRRRTNVTCQMSDLANRWCDAVIDDQQVVVGIQWQFVWIKRSFTDG